jgi:hypothetical protein
LGLESEIIFKIKTALQIDITFDQILSMVRQLPKQQKIKLSEELETVRQEIYDKQKR